MSSTDFGNYRDLTDVQYDITGTLVPEQISKDDLVSRMFYSSGTKEDPGNKPFDLNGRTPEDILTERQFNWQTYQEELKKAELAKQNPFLNFGNVPVDNTLTVDTKTFSQSTISTSDSANGASSYWKNVNTYKT